MHRQILLNQLINYRNTWAQLSHDCHDLEAERRICEHFLEFVQTQPGCLLRETNVGHVTGSALIVDSTLSRVLLTLHGKLGKWLQLGGHGEGETNPADIALREAREESGLLQLSFLPYETAMFGPFSTHPLPFDIDIHEIPGNNREASHLHFDVRYLLLAEDGTHLPTPSAESSDLRWFTLEEARLATQEQSMERQFHKLDHIRSCLLADRPHLPDGVKNRFLPEKKPNIGCPENTNHG